MQNKKNKMSFRRSGSTTTEKSVYSRRFLPRSGIGVEMTNKKFNLLFSLLLMIYLFSSISFSQWKHELFPSDLNIQPFTANFLEPKAGFLISTDNNKLRLDISTSRDIVHWYDEGESISIGADVIYIYKITQHG